LPAPAPLSVDPLTTDGAATSVPLFPPEIELAAPVVPLRSFTVGIKTTTNANTAPNAYSGR
jgi:hypothetical protein